MSSETRGAGESRGARVLLGFASNVKSIRTREVSQILVEAPDDYHVGMTNLLHGQDVLIVPSTLAALTPFGLLDADDHESPHASNQDAPSESGSTAPAVTIHGRVVTVKAAPSRSLSVVCVEIPGDCHVAATSTLFDRSVLLIPCRLKAGTPYGIVGAGQDAAPDDTAPQRNREEPSAEPRNPATSAPSTGLLPSEAERRKSALQWMAIACKDERFLAFLGVASEEAAREALLARCGADSRREIAGDATKRRLVQSEFRAPYEAWLDRRRQEERRTPTARTSRSLSLARQGGGR